jgi:phosphatidylinositol-3-phosphatase
LRRFAAPCALLAGSLTLAACGGAGSPGRVPGDSAETNPAPLQAHQRLPSRQAGAVPNVDVIQNGGFESGLSPWILVGRGRGTARVVAGVAHTGTHSAFMGTKVAPAVNGLHGVSQAVTIPSGGSLSFWYRGGSNDTAQYADQEADLTDSSGTVVFQCLKTLVTTTTWTQQVCDVSAFAGQSLNVTFGVNDNGYSRTYVYLYVDDVSLVGGGPTPTPSPTPSGAPSPTPTPSGGPTPTPSPTPSPSPTSKPSPTPTPSPKPTPTATPGGPHASQVTVVIMENRDYNLIIGSGSAPYINGTLVPQAALMTNSHAVSHPSQPNYLAFFSGSTQGISDDSCPHTFGTPNLGAALLAAGKTFDGYSESMPSNGYLGCTTSLYARKHNPWSDFSNVPASSNLVYTGFPATPPTVAIIVPNLCNDMHDCSTQTGDTWLQANLPPILQWEGANGGLLILTWDEASPDANGTNQIATLLIGPTVNAGSYSQNVNHYSVLHTIETIAGAACTASACTAPVLTGMWK